MKTPAQDDFRADDKAAGRLWHSQRRRLSTSSARDGNLTGPGTDNDLDATKNGRVALSRQNRPLQRDRENRRLGLARVTGRLATASMFITAMGFLTGPIQARALGPVGRGDLAAIVLPIAVAPTLLSLGLGTYLMRETARRRSLGTVVGSVGSLLVLIGVLGAVAAPAIAHLFAGGRPVVYHWLLIGFLAMPLSMFTWILSDVATGLGRWTMLIIRTAAVPVVTLLALGGLYAFGALTVATAALVTIIVGLLSVLPLLPLIREIGRPRFDKGVCAEGLRFGSKAWIGGLGSLVNVRLDQLLMTRLVAPRELGLYAVAVTASVFLVSPVLNGLGAGIIPRSATEDFSWLGRVLRVALMLVACIGAIVALATPVAMPLLFGSSFSGAVPMVWVLVLGTIPLAGVNILSTAMTLGGRPGFSAVSELVAVGVTIPALVVVLPIWGGLGAATVSLAAYSLNFIVLLYGTKHHIGLSWRDLLAVRRADLELLRDRLLGLMPSGVRHALPTRLGGTQAAEVVSG